MPFWNTPPEGVAKEYWDFPEQGIPGIPPLHLQQEDFQKRLQSWKEYTSRMIFNFAGRDPELHRRKLAELEQRANMWANKYTEYQKQKRQVF